jgi:hypothetical protein
VDAKGNSLNAVCFPQTANRYPVAGKGFYGMKGKVVEEFGVFTVEVKYCKKVGIKDRGRRGMSFCSKHLCCYCHYLYRKLLFNY